MMEIIGSFLGALGFGIMYNLSDDLLILAGINGAVSSAMYKLSAGLGLNEFASMTLASLASMIMSSWLASRKKVPALTFSTCGLIPLVPGRGIFHAFYYWMINSSQASFWARLTLFQGAGIAFGCFIASGIVQLILHPVNE